MTLSITHTKVSGKAAGTDTTRVYGTHWDAAHTLTGTVSAAQLNSDVVQAITNDTNITGSITAQNLTLGWTGTLALSRLEQGTDGQLIIGQTSAAPQYKSITGDISVTAAGAVAVNALHSGALSNPTGTIGLSAVNGSATTAMRSDGTPALSQAIIPTWTGKHTFITGTGSSNTASVFSASTDATLPAQIGATTGVSLNAFAGSSGTPFTASTNPTAIISRVETISTGTSPVQNAALLVGSHGISQSTGGASATQTQGIMCVATKDAASTGDVCPILGLGYHFGTNGTAFGAFFESINVGTNNTLNCITVETSTINESGLSRAYSPTPGTSPAIMGFDIGYSNGGLGGNGGPAIQIRASAGQWDVGIGFMNGNPISKADIQSDTAATSLWLANSGSHTYGLNWTAASFSTSAIATPGFTVGGTGITTLNLNSGSLPTAPTGNLLHVGNADGVNARILLDAFGVATPVIDFRRANTSAASPSALAANDSIGGFVWFGYQSGGAYSASSIAAVLANAAENLTSSAQGSYITLNTTPIGSTTRTEAVRIQPSGGVSIGLTTDPGIGKLITNSSLIVASAALATTATDGFLYIPSCAGAPTGTPTAFTGRVPLVYDSTNNFLYVNNGGWKKSTVYA